MNDKEEIITLEVFKDDVTVSFVKNKLEEAGIECFVEEENIVGLNPLGGAELKIFGKDLIRAKEILAQ